MKMRLHREGGFETRRYVGQGRHRIVEIPYARSGRVSAA